MTYLNFLLVFLVPPIVVFGLLQRRPLAGVGGWRGWVSLPLTCLIAFVYTTPWDNYLVYREVWGYGPDRVLGTLGYVPYEEYAFFVLQPILTGLFLYTLLAYRLRRRPLEAVRTAVDVRAARLAGGLLYGVATVSGIALLMSGWLPGLYLGLILAWAGPILLGLWLYAGPFIWSLRHTFVPAVAIPTVYLWIADALAIRMGIWYISDATSLNVDPLGLPVEEATFFLVTNLLVVQGVLLFLFGDVVARNSTAPAPLASTSPNAQ